MNKELQNCRIAELAINQLTNYPITKFKWKFIDPQDDEAEHIRL